MNIISHKLCSLGNSIALKKIQLQPCVLVTILVGLFILLRHTNINLKRKVQTCMVSGQNSFIWVDCFLLCSCFECSQFSEAVLHECESMSPGKQKDINPRNSKKGPRVLFSNSMKIVSKQCLQIGVTRTTSTNMVNDKT